MKKTLSILICVLSLLLGCKEGDKKANNEASVLPPAIEKTEAPADKTLCKINGKPWNYTEASGVLVTDKNRDLRILTLTFTKYLNPGKEHLSLTYDEATKELIEASVQLKQAGKDDKRIHAIYLFNERTVKDNPQSSISGNVSLDDEKASGTAQLNKLHIQYEGSRLANQKDADITLTDLSFKDIPYSDVQKEMEAIFKKPK